MEKEVLETIQKYNLIENGDRIVLGVSGGPDSLSMLHILNNIKNRTENNLKFEVFVAHINHMIRKEADEEEKFVEEFCKKINVQFFSKRINVIEYANNKRISTEEAGRILRYEFFEEVLKKTDSNKIAIAHNLNDKVETILIHMFRGSGMNGLIGIEPKRDNKFIRPLIETTRETIEKYCEEKNLNPCIDKSNFENIYLRNKIRNELIPYIKKEINPNIIESIDRLSDLIKSENDYIENKVEEIYNQILIKYEKNLIVLDLKKFNVQEKVIKSRTLMYAIKKLKGSSKGIEKKHIEDIISLCDKNIGNKFLVPNKGIKVLVKYKKIHIILE